MTSVGTGNGLHATHDARAIVRLLQCQLCFRPLKRPALLPCGNSICYSCLPPLHERQYITYPNTPDRHLGLLCPFGKCQTDHARGDFNVDYTLTRTLDIIGVELEQLGLAEEISNAVIEEEVDHYVEGKGKPVHQTIVYPRGRFPATYGLAELGRLPYDQELSYRSSSGEDTSQYDAAVLGHVKDKVRSELQCLVCYMLYLDPITTSCGHTFCRKCLERVLDYSYSCPLCRKPQHISTTSLEFHPSNQRLISIIEGLFPNELAQRAIMSSLENKVGASNLDLPTPLFVCTLSFPRMPTFLHIFEPRYRLMIRRVWQGDRRFGMVLPNRNREPQGELGEDCAFMQFGTLLEIKSYRLLPDGRSWIETIGVSRFRVKRFGYRDDYIVSDVEIVNDLPISEEELVEAMETSTTGSVIPDGSLQSTQQLLHAAQAFVHRMQSRSPSWLHQRVVNVYGRPPEDPATFPYWLASVLPISEVEKYRLLSTSSVRERLKIVVLWIKKIEEQQWYVYAPPT